MKKVKKCKNCQYNINHYIDNIIKIKTKDFICITCNVTLSDKLVIDDHIKKCIKPCINVKYNYFCSNECNFSYHIRNYEKKLNFRKNLFDVSKNSCHDYYLEGFINSNSYESYKL